MNPRTAILAPFLAIFLQLSQSLSIREWQPMLRPEHLYLSPQQQFPLATQSFPRLVAQSYQQPKFGSRDQCEIYKVGFTQDLYFQYIQYKIGLPKLNEFTLCAWSKFSNHSNDHPLFSYAVENQPRAIYAWVSNSDRSSYFSLSVNGHTFFRLNYPLRLNRWYHSCHSWNGRTGEWQLWVNAERVGRGFHNRLVGHSIPSGGIAITGQEQNQMGGGFLEGDYAPKGAGGMLGEVTMVQFYKVALTAGKAHRDHKHHHAHRFDHNGTPITTTPRPPSPPRPTLPTHPLLTAGQLNPNIALNIASGGQPPPPPQPQIVPGQNFNAQLLNGQFISTLVSQQLAGAGTQQMAQIPGLPQQMNAPASRGPQQFIPQDPQPQPGLQQQFILQTLGGTKQPIQLPQQQLNPLAPAPLITGGLLHPSLVNPANVQFIDGAALETHQLFKRHNENDTATIPSPKTEDNKEGLGGFGKKVPREKTGSSKRAKPTSTPRNHKKRELFLAGGTLIDDSYLTSGIEAVLPDGLATIGENQPVLQQQKNDEREPAEAEVTAVMNLCSGCDEEPFAKALVFGWRTVPKKLYSGAFYIPATPECKAF